MDTPLFSVVIPWHGRIDDLTRAVASLDAQTFTDFETIVVCNGPAVEMMAATAARDAFADCRFIESGAAGVSRARNAGVAAAKGRWIAFLDADDRFLADKLRILSERVTDHRADLFFSRGLRVRGPQLKLPYPAQTLGPDESVADYFFGRGANLSASSIVVRRDIAARVGFAEDLSHYEDPDFVVRCAAVGAWVEMISTPLYEWYDDREDGRLSRGTDYAGMRAWAHANRQVWGDAAVAGFIARRIGQHQLKTHPMRAARDLFAGWRSGRVGFGEVLQMTARGLVPQAVARRLIDLKAQRDADRIAAQDGTAPGS